MSANDRTGVGHGSGEWCTPDDLYERLHRRFQFTYDAFASHANTKCDLYSTIEGTFERSSDERACLGSAEDGLGYPWEHRRVFMNPPYTRGLIERCIEKAYAERDSADIIVALLPAATETRWFQRYILPACHIDWLPRRVHYIDPQTGQPGGSPPSGAIIAVFKTELML